MELFLLFSLALTFVAFLSIVLAESPVPITGVDTDLTFGTMMPITTVQNDQAPGIAGSASTTDGPKPAAALAIVEELQTMY